MFDRPYQQPHRHRSRWARRPQAVSLAAEKPGIPSYFLPAIALLIMLILAGCASAPASDDQAVLIAPAVTITEVPADPTAVPTATPIAETEPAESVVAPTSAPMPEATQAAPFQPEAVNLTFTPIITGLTQPIFVTHAGDGSDRLFVVERRGVIWVYAPGQAEPALFLDIRDRVTDAGQEQGLLGLAFDPAFAESGAFWINYTAGRGDTTLARFQVSADDPNRADVASEQVLLSIDQPAGNHNGGMLAFGPDGMLWMGTGDGGAANDRYGNGQNPATLLGKMLRLDVTSTPGSYGIPADNPWIDQTWNGQDVRDEVWAVGLRNPWRYSFDRLTGDLWIGDVGQNVYEEVGVVAAGTPGGLNFGWPIMEGTHCFPDTADCDPTGLEMPVADYRHGGDGCSVTGGYVYRGQDFPVLNGAYLYSDYCSGNIWAIYADGETQGDNPTWVNTLLTKTQSNVSSFGEDEAGELYLVDMGQGTVYRLGVE